MVGSDVESQWYQALYEEDCLRIMTLLKEHPSSDLWKQGWKSEPSRMVEGSRLNYWKPRTRSPWKGRTALHVGARRGCAELLNQVLGPCKAEEIAEKKKKKKKKRPNGFKNEYPQDSAGVSKSVSLQDPPSRNEEISEGHSEITEATERGGYQSAGVSKSVSLQDLLLEKDGEYQLDAIAMAMVNGNSEIVRILLEAGLLCPDIVTKYGMHHQLTRQLTWNPTEAAEMEEHKKELRSVTESVIARFVIDLAFRREILEVYTRDRDFNFLPRAEYLFHFLFTRRLSGDKNTLRCIALVVLGETVFQSSPVLWSFLWQKLQDGQGRLPLHVAVDEENIDGVFGPVFGHRMPEDDEMIKRIIKAVDGGGRTAFHRAIMGGSAQCRDIVDLLKRYTGRLRPGVGFVEFNDRDDIGDCSPVVYEAFLECQRNIRIANSKNSRENIARAIIESSTSRQVTDIHVSDAFRDDVDFTLNQISKENGFKSSRYGAQYPTPIHDIIIRKNLDCLETLLEGYKRLSSAKLKLNMTPKSFFEDLLGTPNLITAFQWSHKELHEAKMPPWRRVEIDSLMLAILVGDESMVRRLLALEKKHQVPIILNSDARARVFDTKIHDLNLSQGFEEGLEEGLEEELVSIHPLHLAATTGQYGVLKSLTDHDTCDLLVEDYGGNNALQHALHHANVTGESFKFETHLLDYVNCEHIRDSRCDLNESKDLKDVERLELLKNEKSLIARQGCISLLLQLGCNILRTNNAGRVPYPGNDSEMDAKLRAWWHDKQDKEFAKIQSTLSVAANAISVTAALVAATSYVGPLQPPLGYDEISGRLQLNNIWVKIFLFCNTLSFYLAIGAIISSLVPSLPMPQRSMMVELRRMVTLATLLLVPSLLFVLIAFASGSFAVAHPRVGSWNNGNLTIVTASIGGFVCLITIIFFSIRLARIILGRNGEAWVRKTKLFFKGWMRRNVPWLETLYE